MRDSAGNLYGTASSGGAGGLGVVYEVNCAGHQTVLYTFKGGADGSAPQAGVIGDSAGNLYGTTGGGGTANAGVVYKVNQAGQETVLYTFTGGTDGGYPTPGLLIRDSARNLNGTTYAPGYVGRRLACKKFDGTVEVYPGSGSLPLLASRYRGARAAVGDGGSRGQPHAWCSS